LPVAAASWLTAPAPPYAGFPIIVVRSAVRPVNKVTAELGFKLADGFVAKEIVEIEQANEQQVVLRPCAFVALILGPL
jgi:hypothetical protein